MEDIITDTQIHGHSLRGFLLTFILCTFSLGAFSQAGLSTESKKAKKLYEKADKKYRERDFTGAISLLEESTKEDPNFFEAYIRMGSLYNAMGNEDSVYSKFQKYAGLAPDPLASVLEKLSFMAFDRGEYEKAQSFLDSFLKRVPERSSGTEIQLLIKSLEFVNDQLSKPGDSVIVETLPSEINRFKLQYLPSVTIDNAAIFYTKRDDVRGDEDIVVSHYKNGSWQSAQSVSSRINSPLNEGACSVSADGRTLIFTSCDDKYSLGSCDLYITQKVGDVWSQPKNIGKPVNSIYWESQPSLSADGKTLYFSSNRKGGYGGRDLWVSKNTNGKWTEPVNLGEAINSPRDETTPFIHPNGTWLYFSANGYPGMGGYDLYVSKFDSVWHMPENLGYPINTFRDEVAIVITGDGSQAYFAKEEQKNFEILESKLVSIKLPLELKATGASYIVGNVTDSKTGKPLGAEIEIIDLTTNEKIYQSKSDSLSGEYYMVLPSGLSLGAYVKKKGYLYSDQHFTSEINDLSSPDTLDLLLDPVEIGKSIVLKNIYFDLDSYEIREESQSEIENAFQLMRQNPKIIVEIAGHTDDSGTRSHNMELSKQRAKAVHDRLIEMGINSDRLNYKGYADSSPLLPNTSENNRKSNRRIEFRVLRVSQ
ncbi:MAG: OmpA family protein [Ekhidna sp.]|uniref:OmpA family protein n=1 Tax=Ekhidna sp. TaxID=2608089 RepID=UPI0032EE847C